jgi:SAM-dependent methyltransferase
VISINFKDKLELKQYVLSKGCYSFDENLKIYKSFFEPAYNTFQSLRKKRSFSKSKILDVGCHYGHFLIHFSNESLGVDIQDHTVKFAKSLRVNAIECNIEDYIPVGNESYEMIFASQVLEHMVSPHKLMREFHRILVHNGVAVISVPNIDAVTLSSHPGWKFSEHIYAFNAKSLSFLCERSGFKVLERFHLCSKLDSKTFRVLNPFLLRYGSMFFIIVQKSDNFQYSSKRLDCFFPSWIAKGDKQ